MRLISVIFIWCIFSCLHHKRTLLPLNLMQAVKNIFIVDDHQMVIDGLRLIIDTIEGFEIVGESTSALHALDVLETVNADILLTDVSMPEMSGIELTRLVKKKHPHIKIITLSMFSESQVVAE